MGSLGSYLNLQPVPGDWLTNLDWEALNTCKDRILQVSEGFFEVSLQGRMLAVGGAPRDWRGAYTGWAPWPEQPDQECHLRLSRVACNHMLDSSLGSIARSQWTELEKRIVEGFLANLMESLEEHLGNWQPNNLEGRGRVYLIVAIPTPAKLGLLALGVPVSRLPLLPADRAPARQTSECGALETIVSASAGSANVSVAEIMAMEAGDMVLLENSSSQALTLLARGQEWKSISLKPGDEWPQSLQLNPEELAEMSKGQQSNDDESNMLSSFPVELRAEFREIRLPLSRLLALDKGEALPLADLSDTELTLTSHGKPVARGELVVVGDKLAVQISEILMKQESSSQAPEA